MKIKNAVLYLILVVIIVLLGFNLILITKAENITTPLQNWFKKFLPPTTIDQVDLPDQSDKSNQPDQPISLYQSVLDYEEAVTRAVEEAVPGVVSVIISKNLPVIERCQVDPFADLPPEIRQFFGPFSFEFFQPCPGDSTQEKQVGVGSGFVVEENGLIATNKHVILEKEASYTIITSSGQRLKAKVVALDPLMDLGFLKAENGGRLHPLELGDSDSLKLGQTVIAIGNALGEFNNTVSVGVVSGLSRRVTATGPGISEALEGVIQTDAAINPGNSGGPLLNLRGEVVGISVAVAAGAQNVGFAIPVNQIKRSVASVKSSGKINAPFEERQF